MWLPTKHGTGTNLPGHGNHPAYTNYVIRQLDILKARKDASAAAGAPWSNTKINEELDDLIFVLGGKVNAVGDSQRLNSAARSW